jgi:thiamine monophosphate synthase
VQLSDKTASNAELHSLALQLCFELNAVDVKQIINDWIDIILRADAEIQIHMGRNDLKLPSISIKKFPDRNLNIFTWHHAAYKNL